MKYKVLPIILEATRLAQGHAFVYHDIHTVFTGWELWAFFIIIFFLGHIDLIDVNKIMTISCGCLKDYATKKPWYKSTAAELFL